MSENVLTAVLALAGTLIGTFGGILTGSKLITYRVEQLEKKVEKHNEVVGRTYRLEGAVTELQHDVHDIKAKL